MKNPKPNILSYLAALIIGVILFATLWKSIFGSASSPVVISGILGVAVAVVLLLAVSRFRRPKD
jgi:glucan phosphoethanolaminetransferase (alkaline phosphatase superfamily)